VTVATGLTPKVYEGAKRWGQGIVIGGKRRKKGVAEWRCVGRRSGGSGELLRRSSLKKRTKGSSKEVDMTREGSDGKMSGT